MAIDLVSKTRDVVANVENPTFVGELEALLPDTLPVRRFVQVAKTAIRTNPDLVGADQNSLFSAIVRCAQDGLVPDNVEAALVPYKGKVSYLRMIDGVRKIAAEYGWTLRTRVVFTNDEFEYVEEPPSITHRPVRPGVERGERIAAYAVATHRDGRRLQRVMYPEEIAKRRSKAQTQKVWDEWPDAMWAKSVGHAIFDELPKSERELLDRLTVEELTENGSAAELLYGPQENGHSVTPSVAEASPPAGPQPSGGDFHQQAPAAPHPAGATGDEIEDGEFEPVDDEPEISPEEFAAAASTKVKSGHWIGQTFAQIAEAGDEGKTWLLVQMKKLDPDGNGRKLAIFLQGRCPDVWQRYVEWKAEQ